MASPYLNFNKPVKRIIDDDVVEVLPSDAVRKVRHGVSPDAIRKSNGAVGEGDRHSNDIL